MILKVSISVEMNSFRDFKRQLLKLSSLFLKMCNQKTEAVFTDYHLEDNGHSVYNFDDDGITGSMRIQE